MLVDSFAGSPKRSPIFWAYWIFGTFMWASWFMQTPLLISYWVAGHHVPIALAVSLISGISLVTIFMFIPIGRAVDRWGLRWGLGPFVLLSAIGFAARAFFTGNFTGMLVCTLFGGLGVAAQSVGNGPVVMRLFPKREYAHMIALGDTSKVTGQIVGIILTSLLYGLVGIENAFIIYGVVWVLVAILWFAVCPSADREEGIVSRARLLTFKEGIKLATASWPSWFIILMGLFLGGLGNAVATILPGYLGSAIHVSPETAGVLAGTLSLGSLIGLLTIPRAAARRQRMKLAAALGLAVALVNWLLLWALGADSAVQAVIQALILGISYEMAWAIGLTLFELLQGDPADSGLAAAAYGTSTGIGAFIAAEVVGIIVGSYGYSGAFLTISVVLMCGLISILFARVTHVERSTAETMTVPQVL